MFSKFNEVNLQLQGDETLLIKAKFALAAFFSKLQLYSRNLGRCEFRQFPCYVTIPPFGPHTRYITNSSNHSLLYGRWSTSGSERGNTHFLPLQEFDRGNNRTNEQIRAICLGLTQEQKGSMQHYISDSIYGLTLAWITSKNSTKQLECRLIFPHCGWTLMSCWLASLLRCPESTASVRVPSPTHYQLLCPTNSLLASRYHFRTRRDFKSKNPLSGFAPKQTKESSAWWATYIVLQLVWEENRSEGRWHCRVLLSFSGPTQGYVSQIQRPIFSWNP